MPTSALDRARAAREALARLLSGRPGVTGIDIGIGAVPGKASAHSPVVLRVHVSRGAAEDLDLPSEMEGIPVEVVVGDYRAE